MKKLLLLIVTWADFSLYAAQANMVENPAQKEAAKSITKWQNFFQERFGQDLNKADERGVTPLYRVTQGDSFVSGGYSVADLQALIECKADVFADKYLLVTAIASATDACEKTKLLLEKGVSLDPRVSQKDYIEPLHRAIHVQNPAIVQMLLHYGACPNACDNHLVFPLAALRDPPEKDIGRLLICYGTVPSYWRHSKTIEQKKYDELLKEHNALYKESLKKILTPHLPAFEGKSGAPLVELTIEYTQPSLADEIIFNKAKARENIERLNKTLPAERQREIPEHLLQEFVEQKQDS